MGIGNPRQPRCLPIGERVSLPLMGIGNSRMSRSATGRRHPLITPHGDRELERFAITFRDPVQGLITPHGDREQLGDPRSLPVAVSHYPSWGSGTGRLGAVKIGNQWRSLPLMGIGNLREGRAALPYRQQLITPHGDREPQHKTTNKEKAETHYPSWGSGTTPGGKWLIMRYELITPHGDRELSIAGSRYGGSPGSLPLMGIGNDRGVAPAALTHELITPHGDREPRSPSTTWHRPTSSLPLMGIGNFQAHSDITVRKAPHYPSWGSGT